MDFRVRVENNKIQIIHTVCEEIISGDSFVTHLGRLIQSAARHECPED
jgi:hypothetical protein